MTPPQPIHTLSGQWQGIHLEKVPISHQNLAYLPSKIATIKTGVKTGPLALSSNPNHFKYLPVNILFANI